MGGEVWYERSFPTGARFCYSLPLLRHTVVGDVFQRREPVGTTQVVEMDEALFPDSVITSV